MSEIESYIEAFPEAAKTAMKEVYGAIKAVVPDAKEKISYGMPALEWAGPLVYFGGFRNHIGLYALPSGNTAFQAELQHYKTGKGSIQFPLDEPMPLDLIKRIVQFRIEENMAKIPKKKRS